MHDSDMEMLSFTKGSKVHVCITVCKGATQEEVSAAIEQATFDALQACAEKGVQ